MTMHIQELLARILPFTPKPQHFNLIMAVEHHPYQYMFLLILLEEAGMPLPIPGDAFLLLFGVWSREGKTSLPETLLIVSLGTLIGASILYYVAWHFGRPLIDRYGKYLHITHQQIARMENWMGRYGGLAIALARLTPGLRIVSTVAAGVLKMPYRTFILANMVATWIWITAYFYIGIYVGKRYGEYINQLLGHQMIVLAIAGVAFVVWILFIRYIAPRLHHGNTVDHTGPRHTINKKPLAE